MRFKKLKTICILITVLGLAGCDHTWIDNHSHLDHQIWKDMRQGFQIPDASNQPEVQEQILFYQQHPHTLIQAIKPAKQYLPYIIQALKTRRLPTEIALLPIVESTYDPFAHSRVGASGLWQMMPGTATNKQIKINYWYDGRRDLIDSTRGALDHLSYLHDLFHDWTITIAAYDAGEGRVSKAIQDLGFNANINFFDLKLPKETMSYVPKLLAIKAIISHPEKYNIVLPPIDKSIQFSTLETKRAIDFKQLAKSLNMTEASLRALNPGFRRATTEPNYNSRLLIPNHAYVQAIQVIFNSRPSTYMVKAGDSLSSIAKKFKTTVSQISMINQLQDADLQIGQRLILLQSQTPESMHQIGDEVSADKKPGPVQKIHIVKPNEDLETIAKQYQLPKSHLVYWNNLSCSKLQPNQKIIIWLKKAPRHYVIQSGDTLELLSKKFNISISALKSINKLSSNLIKIGQTLQVTV
ncbi:MAG: LysM peptidoglycan-binding domain-containing protein [Gammaproteobacteria bacterium]|nr:LysM peptidoglycan-binding domain-containing protein [Gammaproteobacteria bacterium]